MSTSAFRSPDHLHALDIRLERVFQDVFDDESLRIHDRTTAADIPEWDSIAHVNLMFAIEQEFGIQFAGNELAEFRDVGELKRYLRSKV